MPKGIFERKKKPMKGFKVIADGQHNDMDTTVIPATGLKTPVTKLTHNEIIINEWLYSCTLGKLIDQLSIANPSLKEQILNQRPHRIPSGVNKH